MDSSILRKYKPKSIDIDTTFDILEFFELPDVDILQSHWTRTFAMAHYIKTALFHPEYFENNSPKSCLDLIQLSKSMQKFRVCYGYVYMEDLEYDNYSLEPTTWIEYNGKIIDVTTPLKYQPLERVISGYYFKVYDEDLGFYYSLLYNLHFSRKVNYSIKDYINILMNSNFLYQFELHYPEKEEFQRNLDRDLSSYLARTFYKGE